MLTIPRVQECAEALGFTKITDTKSPDALCDGFATLDVTVNKNMQRMSTFDVFLPKELALKRVDDLTICTGAVVSRIEFSTEQDLDRSRADRVVFQDVRSAEKESGFSVSARREIILCSGAIGSPQILMLRFVWSLKTSRVFTLIVPIVVSGLAITLRT